MNSVITTLEHPVSPLHASTVLARNGFTCTLLTLEPDAETALPAAVSPGEQLLYVLSGDIVVHSAGLATLVSQGQATLLAAGETPVLSAHPGTAAQVLRVEIPPRQVSTPQIITLSSDERMLRRVD